MKPILFSIVVIAVFITTGCKNTESIKLPDKGLCAHRGALETHPENTIPAFQAAINAGAQMIEFDVWLTKDKQMVIIHDPSVDRTTNGKGKVTDLTLAEIKTLDAGSWKSPEFTGEKIPTLVETLDIMPNNIWLNIHIKGEGELPVMVARTIKEKKRQNQAFMACNAIAARQAKEAVPEIMICNMERQNSTQEYVEGTIRMKTGFIQLLKKGETYTPEQIKKLKANGIKINYFKADSSEEIIELFKNGIDFPLVNDIVHFIETAKEMGIQPVQPVFKP